MKMEITIDISGEARVDAHAGEYTIRTDQPLKGGGEGSAPAPFTLFLASIGTCAGFYVLKFCRQRGLSTDGIRLVERVHSDPESHMVRRIELEIEIPPTFPAQYHAALIHSANLCAVKKHLENPPEITTHTKVIGG